MVPSCVVGALGGGPAGEMVETATAGGPIEDIMGGELRHLPP